MTAIRKCIQFVLAAIAFFVLANVPAVVAQAPGSTDPNAQAVHEHRLLHDHYLITGVATIQDTRSYILEQPLGRVWRLVHEVWMHWIGGIVIFTVIALLLGLYLIRGPLRIEGGRSGKMIPRFNGLERATHWMIAVSFAILAVTGLNITFGKKLLLPLIGPDAFSRWSLVAKYAHDCSSFPFVLGVIVLVVLWAKDNLPTAVDIRWFKEGGGMIGNKHPPAWKFNGGQKALFWVSVLGTVALTVSGMFLLFPFYWTNIIGMQVAQVIHALISIAFVATIIAHVYIGSLGMEGGWDAMASGEVDLNWAKQHHSLWVEQLNSELVAPPQTNTSRA
jgi:formate dehydrogenase subunit gamma